MRPTIEQLHQSDRYRLIESFSIDEMLAFVQREMKLDRKPAAHPAQPSPRSLLRLAAVTLFSGLLGYTLAHWLLASVDKQAIRSGFEQAGVGFVAFFPLLPVHEFIHGLAYRRVGAPNVGYGYSVKSLMVYAYSQKFPTTLREMAFVAVMPFLLISAALLVGWLLWPACPVFWVTLLVVHTSGCIGDFVLINYWYKNRRRLIYTYDDVEGERRSYFFEAVETVPIT